MTSFFLNILNACCNVEKSVDMLHRVMCVMWTVLIGRGWRYSWKFNSKMSLLISSYSHWHMYGKLVIFSEHNDINGTAKRASELFENWEMLGFTHDIVKLVFNPKIGGSPSPLHVSMKHHLFSITYGKNILKCATNSKKFCQTKAIFFSFRNRVESFVHILTICNTITNLVIRILRLHE